MPFLSTFTGGISLDVCRVNADLIPDIIVGTGNRGGSNVQVLDGLNGSIISSFVAYTPAETSSYNAPFRVAAVDRNFDGIADVITTAQGSDGSTRSIKSFNALNGQLVDSFFETSPDFAGAYFVADLRSRRNCGSSNRLQSAIVVALRRHPKAG